MIVRAYRAADDPALMAIEYRSPRGASAPFVHYRQRFAARAELFDDHQIFVLEVADQMVGCIGIAVKEVQISGSVYPIGYLFDLRVDPDYRRQGYGGVLIRHAETYLVERGVLGAYGTIVSVNLASLRLFEGEGYRRIRQLLYLEYSPAAAPASAIPIECDDGDDLIRFTPLVERDFYVEGVAQSVAGYDYAHWFHESERGYANLSAFNQSRVYKQIMLDDLHLPDEVLRQQARSLRLFHPIGADQPDLLGAAFDTARDLALSANYYQLSAVIDAEETLPGFFFAEAHEQKRYWLVFRSLHADFNPVWSSPFYVDARDV